MKLEQGSRIFVAGHRGMVGQAIIRALQREGPGRFEIITESKAALDLTRQEETEAFLTSTRPDLVVNAAAKVGGIEANRRHPAAFAYVNLTIAANLIHGCHLAGVRRLLNLGSSCVYPKHAEQPIREDSLLTGPLEATNEGYAIAKIAAIKLCDFYREEHGLIYHSAMPCNLYGPGDNYHPENSHVIPALLRRFHEARGAKAGSVTLWGSGTPLREFLHTDDLARACLVLLREADPPGLVNVGAGVDLSIAELGRKIATTVGFSGDLHFDPSMPDGTPRKLLDSGRMRSLGWHPEIPLEQGLAGAYQDFLAASAEGTLRSR